jgi:CPA2 family monovalent cation:H+ antiporter-2
MLMKNDIPFVIAEQNRELVESLRADGRAAVSGNAADPGVLIQAHIARASLLVVATPDAFAARQMISVARTLNPSIEIVVRTHNEEEAVLLEQEAVEKVFLGENELAQSISQHVLKRYGKSS